MYLALVAAPLAVLFVGSIPKGGGFWWNFAMALGFAGMAMMGVQFILTARFRRPSAPFGIDIVYYFHRFLAVLAFLIICAHAAIALWAQPGMAAWLNPSRAPWYMTAGTSAFLVFLAIIATSLWRKQIGLEYDVWRVIHAFLATVGFLLALLHIEGVGYFISDPLQRILWTAIALVHVALIVHVRIVRPWLLMRRPYRVSDVRKEPGRVWSVALAPVGHAGFAFVPGQFAWLSLGVSPFHMREHPFSISSAPRADGSVEFTIKELGDFTRRIGTVSVGTVAYIDGPYGLFCAEVAADAPGLGFIAGGVGIAPIVSILRDLADRGDRRPMTLFFGNRVEDHILFRAELDQLSARLKLNVVHMLTEPPPGWQGETGFLDLDILRRHLPPGCERFAFFVCGPDPMIRLAERSLTTLGVSVRAIHSEIFDLA